VLSFAGFQGWESTIRRRAVSRLELRPGGAVLDVACGRGSNFGYTQQAIGQEGRIVGLDYSPEMLAGAAKLVRAQGWTNVELVQADAAEMTYTGEFDGAICTIAMLVIPRWRDALHRMLAAVRPGGRVVVMDGRLGTAIRRLGNPYARLFARITGADLTRDVPGEFLRLTVEAQEETMFLGTYYILSGRVPGEAEDKNDVQAGR